MFEVGMEVLCVEKEDANADPLVRRIAVGEVNTIVEIYRDWEGDWLVFGHDEDDLYDPSRFRPLAKRTDTLTIESFLTIKPGFEEPRRRVVEPVKEEVG